VLLALSGPTARLPAVACAPLQLPEAVQALAWSALQLSVAMASFSTALGDALSDTVGAGVDPAGEPAGEATAELVAEPLCPPPQQASVRAAQIISIEDRRRIAGPTGSLPFFELSLSDCNSRATRLRRGGPRTIR
jgi:hypothetical protein